jgi:hypothetical protein
LASSWGDEMRSHRLTEKECACLGSLVAEMDQSRVRIYRSNVSGPKKLLRGLVLWLSRYRAIALGNHIFLPDRKEHDLAVLAHEVTHCRQYQAWGAWTYFTRGAATQLRDLFYRTMRIGSSPYRYTAVPGQPFHAYGMEQQGQIVEDCFRGHPVALAISPFHPGTPNLNQVVPSA